MDPLLNQRSFISGSCPSEYYIPFIKANIRKHFFKLKFYLLLTSHIFLVGPLHWDSQIFGLAEHVTDILWDQPLDGVFGLAWPLLSAYNERPPLMNILDQLDQPVFTVWVDW
jgi:hypothetical protein